MNNIKATLKNLWNGNIPLAHTFWLYYFVGVVVLRFIAGIIGPVSVIVIVAWSGFMIVPILRSSYKYRGNQIYALLAKIFVVFTTFGLLGSLFL